MVGCFQGVVSGIPVMLWWIATRPRNIWAGQIGLKSYEDREETKLEWSGRGLGIDLGENMKTNGENVIKIH